MNCPGSHQKRGKKPFPAVPGTHTSLCSSPNSNFLRREEGSPGTLGPWDPGLPGLEAGRGRFLSGVVLRLPRLKAVSEGWGASPRVAPQGWQGEAGRRGVEVQLRDPRLHLGQVVSASPGVERGGAPKGSPPYQHSPSPGTSRMAHRNSQLRWL